MFEGVHQLGWWLGFGVNPRLYRLRIMRPGSRKAVFIIVGLPRIKMRTAIRRETSHLIQRVPAFGCQRLYLFSVVV
jgi:hypothetical protein